MYTAMDGHKVSQPRLAHYFTTGARAEAQSQTERPKCPPRVYYGNGELEGRAVRVGGRDVVVDGWAAYEVARREARWRANPQDPAAEPRSKYGGRTYITCQDAVESLVTERSSDPLRLAAERLAAAVAGVDTILARGGPTTAWERLGVPQDAPLAVSTLTPEEIRRVAAGTNPVQLYQIAEDVGIFASRYARKCELSAVCPPRPPDGLPPFPVRTVSLMDRAGVNQSVIDLEKTALPRAAAVEAYRGDVAAAFDVSAAVLERAAASEAGEAPTRPAAEH
jgi:hypothetical protein